MDLITYLILSTLSIWGQSEDPKTVECMVTNIWHEARGEDLGGYARIAQTVMNRIDDPRFPDNPCAVIYADGAFSWTEDSLSDDVDIRKLVEADIIEEMVLVSLSAMRGDFKGLINGSVSYYNPKKAKPCWESAYDDFLDYGNHRWGYNSNGSTPCWDARNLANR